MFEASSASDRETEIQNLHPCLRLALESLAQSIQQAAKTYLEIKPEKMPKDFVES